jgi:predicted dehydrogenase
MKKINRRAFIKSSAAATALSALSYSRVLGANDRLGAAVIGVRGRGRSHIRELIDIDGVNVIALCDVDANVLQEQAAKLDQPVKPYSDFRLLLQNPDVDLIAIATPDHWHVPVAAQALLAGKHVYVEKPISHTLYEGKYLADLAKKTGRVVQHGTQSHSIETFKHAIEYLQSGQLGQIRTAKAINHQLRDPIGIKPDGPVPPGVDYDMWLGPAPVRPFNPNRFHYNWHWFWDYGSGDTGNDGIHQIDVARWGLGKGFPNQIICSGGQLFYKDDHETPDTQLAVFRVDQAQIIYEMRLWTDYKLEGHDNGNIFYGDNGSLSMGRKGWSVTFKDGSTGPAEPKSEDQHFRNFIDAVRANDPGRVNCDPEEAHISSSMCHMANIAMKLGTVLTFDANTHQFVNNDKANDMMTKSYRKGYELPSV